MEHDSGCPAQTHSDAARRCSDAVNLHVLAIGADATKKWVAIRLADGSSYGTLYDSNRDAVRHQPNEQMCAYVRVTPGGMNVCSAESFMRSSRLFYDAGFRLADPDASHGGMQVIPRLTKEDHAAQMARLR
jgi:hypothetical protein